MIFVYLLRGAIVEWYGVGNYVRCGASFPSFAERLVLSVALVPYPRRVALSFVRKAPHRVCRWFRTRYR